MNMGLYGKVFFLPHDFIQLRIELFGTGIGLVQRTVFLLQLGFLFIERSYLRSLHLCIGRPLRVSNGGF